jgi:hypothetical protein
LALSDYTAGYLRRETNWLWASFSKRTKDHKLLGINFSNGVNETGQTECCIWIDQDFYKVQGINFKFDRLNPMLPWNIFCNEGKIELTFTPLKMRKEKINALLLASNFKQLIGRYDGFLEVKGEKIHIKNILGFAETHYAKW